MTASEPSGKDRIADLWERIVLRARTLWELALELPLLWLGLFMVVGGLCIAPDGSFRSESVRPGAIAGRDYVAVKDLLVHDQDATLERRSRARETVLPVYDFDSGVRSERHRQLSDLFAEGRRQQGLDDETDADDLEPLDPSTRTEMLRTSSGLRLTDATRDLLERDRFSELLEEELQSLFRDLFELGVVADKTELIKHRARGITRRDLDDGIEEVQLDIFTYLAYPQEVKEWVARQVRDWPSSSQARREALIDFTVNNITPNLLPNRSETLARQDRAESATGTVLIEIRKGQVIVRQGDQISATAAETIAQIAGEQRQRTRLLTWLGISLLLLLASAVLWFYLQREPIAGKSQARVFSEVVLMLLVSVVGVRFGFSVATALAGSFEVPPFDSSRSYQYAIPFASLAMLVQLLYGRTVGLVVSLVFGLLVGRIAGPGAGAVAVYAIGGSLTGMYALGRTRFRQRSVLTRAGIRVGAANLVLIVMLLAVSEDGVESVQLVGLDLLCGFAGGLICAATVSFSLPILEALFSATTDIRLIELANTNTPLLHRVAMEAPGTFQHSLMVASLAKTGCEAIGADAVLAYTGGLYHDIGKVYRPEYFIENQRSGDNPHDDLAPEISAHYLVEHITQGLKLAQRHHLPKPITDAISQHHGTRLMSFFHSRALASAATTGQPVDEELFRYPGPRPQDRVMGVLMLADAVEAASRTLVDASVERVRAMIRKIVEACIREGQLDETDLTLADIRSLSLAFEDLLTSLYHRRVDYPGYDFNDESGTAALQEPLENARGESS